MRSFAICLFFMSTVLISIQASNASRQEYLKLIDHYPKIISPPGDFSKGEIQIVLDSQEMAEIERATGREVGLIQQDKYWLWINDACIFPNGSKGVYGRILWVKSLETCPGVAVMPVLPDGRIVLNCNFRHATRSWEIELPRGGVDYGESIEAAAARETLEETGMVVGSLFLLGEIPPDTGLTSTVDAVFMAHVIDQQNRQPEDSEAIEDILALSVPEIKQAFLKGYYEYPIKGQIKRIPFRDPFLAYALLLYEIKNDASHAQ